MVNFGLLAAEIGLPVWGTPGNFNGFRVMDSERQPNLGGGVEQMRHLYSAGRPSRWALTHILVVICLRAECLSLPFLRETAKS